MTEPAYLKSGKKSLFSGSIIYLASNILNASIPFLLLPFLTRHLEPSEYGQVAMFQVLISALAAFVGLNAPSVKIYFAAKLGKAGLLDHSARDILYRIASSSKNKKAKKLSMDELDVWLNGLSCKNFSSADVDYVKGVTVPGLAAVQYKE